MEKRSYPSSIDSSNLKIEFSKYNNTEVIVEYVLYPEAFNKIGGDIQKSPDPLNFEILNQNDNELTFVTPKSKGGYRMFAFVKNKRGQSSVGTIFRF